MAFSFHHLRPQVIGRVKMARFPIPMGTLCRPLRKYSGLSATRTWIPAMGAPTFIERRDESKGLVISTTIKKPYNWGNLLPYFWLRDNCRCGLCVNQDTRQRNFDTFEIPSNITPTEMMAEANGLKIRWSHDSHASFYSWDFLEPYIKKGKPEPEDAEIKFFGLKGYPGARVDYALFKADETRALGLLTNTIMQWGFAFVTQVPFKSPTPTKDLLEMIGPIRKTHYGSFYDFTPNLALKDTAYTNLPLSAHTDNSYFTEPAGLQAFHLLSHEDPSSPNGFKKDLGGLSLLVDGFHAASIMQKTEPELFDILATVGIPCHASGNEGIAIAPDKLYPVIERDAERNMVRRIRWNKDDRAIMPLTHSTTHWYEAARKWDEILRQHKLEYWFQLRPGTVLIFNNWRVLHGRSAFTGRRRICGGYNNRDDFYSKWRTTNFPASQVLKQVIG